MFVCLSVCLFVRLSHETYLELWSIDNQQEVPHGLFKEPILGPRMTLNDSKPRPVTHIMAVSTHRGDTLFYYDNYSKVTDEFCPRVMYI